MGSDHFLHFREPPPLPTDKVGHLHFQRTLLPVMRAADERGHEKRQATRPARFAVSMWRAEADEGPNKGRHSKDGWGQWRQEV